jgi:hypothetical protein
MTPEIKQQLEKYITANGTYDLSAIAADENRQNDDQFGLNETASAFFGGMWSTSTNPESELMQAARAHNESVYEAQDVVIESEIVEILSRTELTKSDWNKLVELNAARIEFNDDSSDGYQPSAYIRLLPDYASKRDVLLGKTSKPTKANDETEEDLARLGL